MRLDTMSRTRVSGQIALPRRFLRRMIRRAIAPDRSQEEEGGRENNRAQLQYARRDRVDNHSEMRSPGKMHRELGRVRGIFYSDASRVIIPA